MSLSTRWLKASLAVLTSAALLVGCASSPSESGEDVITYLEPQFYRTLYPPAAGFYPNGAVVNQLVDRLLYQDPETLELHPWIATELPTVNADATEYTFTIRTDVTYSDGTPMTAENIVRNLDLYGLGDEKRLLTASEQINNYERGEVINDHTVRFHFSAPAPGFAQAVSSYNAGLLADSSLDMDNEGYAPGNAAKVIGSGPFVVESEELGTELILRAREDYNWAPPSHPHQGRAEIDGIDYVLASEESVRSGAMVSDQAQVAREISAPEEAHLKNKGVNIISRGTNSMNNQLNLRYSHPFLADKRVRQAIIHAVDREKIVRILFSQSYPLATSTVAATGLGYKEQKGAYVFDPDAARALLDEAGWVPGPDGVRVKDGRRLELTVNHALPQPRSKEVITMVQEDLRAVGIVLHLNPGDQAAQNSDSKSIDKIQIWHSAVGRADYDVIKSLYSRENRDAFLNSGSDDTAIDQHLEDLLAAVASTPDAAGRAKATEAVQDYITEQAYAVPLFEEPVVYAVQPYIEGFAPEAVARPSFYGVSINHEARKER